MNDNFKQECQKETYMNRIGYVVVGDEIISDNDNLIDFTIEDSCYVDGRIIGTTTSKSATINIREIENVYDTENKKITPYAGVIYEDESEEYLKLGDYTTTKTEHDNVSKTANIIAYDDLCLLDEKYECNIDFNNDITIKDFYLDICSQLKLTPKNTEFLNNNIPVINNPFTNKEKRRDVLSDIAECACSFVDIDWETNEIDLKWVDDEISLEITADNYTELTKNQVYGPVNSLVIKDSQIDGENVTIEDNESIETNGETQIAIMDNYFLYNQELRTMALENIWNRINGFTYTDCSIKTYLGQPYLKRGSKILVSDVDDGTFETYVLNHKFMFDGTFYSEISSPALTKQETKLKNTNIRDVVKNTQVIVNKQQGTITSIVEEQDEQKQQLVQVTQNINNIQNLFQITGGSNLIKDSQRLLEDDVWEYKERTNDGQFPSETTIAGDGEYPLEYYYTESEFVGGYDASLIGKTIAVSKLGIKSGTMKTTSENITNLQVGTRYTLNYLVSNDEKTKATIRLIGANKIYERVIDKACEFQEEIFEFIADTSNYILEITSVTTYEGWTYIYDLMLNSGDKKPWEPAIGEIIGTTLKLSREGLAIYCTGSDIATLMTAQGFQVRRFQNGNLYEVITEFTVNGIVTNKIECTETNTDGLIHKAIQSGGYKKYITYIRS